MKVLCHLRHKWREKSRITWKSDGYSQGKANERCDRCGATRSVFLNPDWERVDA